jgi:hypothetical protein
MRALGLTTGLVVAFGMGGVAGLIFSPSVTTFFTGGFDRVGSLWYGVICPEGSFDTRVSFNYGPDRMILLTDYDGDGVIDYLRFVRHDRPEVATDFNGDGMIDIRVSTNDDAVELSGFMYHDGMTYPLIDSPHGYHMFIDKDGNKWRYLDPEEHSGHGGFERLRE